MKGQKFLSHPIFLNKVLHTHAYDIDSNEWTDMLWKINKKEHIE